MKKWLYIFNVLVIISHSLQAQRSGLNVKVRQSFESTDLKNDPAAVLLTFPYVKAASYAIDGGVAVERESADSRTFGKLTVEYHRNSLIDIEQNNGQIGLGFERYLRRFDYNSNYIVTGTAKYVRDVVATKGSFLHTLEVGLFSPTFNTPIRAGGPNANYVLISPSFGYEYQNTFDASAAAEDSVRGNILRGMGKVKISLTLNKRVAVAGKARTNTQLFERDALGNFRPTKKQLFEVDPAQSIVMPVVQFYINGALRYDLINTTQTPDGWHPYLQAGADYILTRNKTQNPQLSIGINFTTGDNPAQGLIRQQYWLVALRFTL